MSTNSKHGREQGGPIKLSWRYACPYGHQGLRRRTNGFRCQSCGCIYAEAVDLREDERVTIEEVTNR